jgi:hypothetical protein
LLLWAGSAGLALLLVELGAFTVHLNSFEWQTRAFYINKDSI